MNDKQWMQLAYEQALIAQEEGEVPIGAVVVSQDQQLLGVGRNSSLITHDPSAHAEFNAIRQAAQALRNHRLLNTTLYVTLEPCTMCAGLLVHARIHRLVFATRDFKAGAAGSIYNLLQGYPLNHKVIVDEGPLQQECADLLSHFFESRR
ncbi:MAG: tRNA adenosine(34) deaminase TadA [Legionella sp.]|nr:MAG: tRNA adenosine(34) deaminase TadA [Legionella sp.]